MLDEKRIRQMTKLAFFEKKEEKIAVYVISTIRYQGAQKKLKWYGKELDDLQNMYEEQEKSGKKSGRRRKET